MSNSILHTTGFRVIKYGDGPTQKDSFLNVTEDNVADAEVFEFGISMSDEIFEDETFQNETFEVAGAKILKQQYYGIS